MCVRAYRFCILDEFICKESLFMMTEEELETVTSKIHIVGVRCAVLKRLKEVMRTVKVSIPKATQKSCKSAFKAYQLSSF